MSRNTGTSGAGEVPGEGESAGDRELQPDLVDADDPLGRLDQTLCRCPVRDVERQDQPVFCRCKLHFAGSFYFARAVSRGSACGAGITSRLSMDEQRGRDRQCTGDAALL